MSDVSKKRPLRFSLTLSVFMRRIFTLIQQPVFIALTIFGNSVIASSAIFLYQLEKDSNPHIHSLLDTIWWAVSTVTTVGYGDVIPITPTGRVVGIFTMIIGTALFWSFTALFADSMLTRELDDLENQISEIQKIVSKMKKTEAQGTAQTNEIVQKLEDEIHALKRSLRS